MTSLRKAYCSFLLALFNRSYLLLVGPCECCVDQQDVAHILLHCCEHVLQLGRFLQSGDILSYLYLFSVTPCRSATITAGTGPVNPTHRAQHLSCQRRARGLKNSLRNHAPGALSHSLDSIGLPRNVTEPCWGQYIQAQQRRLPEKGFMPADSSR